jgi:hypothetical protein
VSRNRSLRKTFHLLLLALFVLLSVTLAASQIEQHIFRHRAELLLAEIQSLQLRKTPWLNVQQLFKPWAAKMKFADQCNESECSFEITLNEFVFNFISSNPLFVRLDDYIRWRLKLSYMNGPLAGFEAVALRLYMALGGQPATVNATVGMIDGIVSSKAFGLKTLIYPQVMRSFFALRGPDFLWASASTVSRINHVSGSPEAELTLHPNYVIGGPDGCVGCVAGWVNFTPDTNPADVHRLMDFNLSCLTRVLPCRTQLDIMPKAWAQYLAERAHNDSVSH